LNVDLSSVSQQLGVLRNRNLIIGRKQGTSVYYRVVDERVFALLDTARIMFDQQLLVLQAMADEDDALREDADEQGPPEPRAVRRP
jgi:ArsR family transcriptional regulator